MTQNFKGDTAELNIEAAGKPAFDVCSLALDEFFDQAYNTSDFLLALYDEGRMPFSARIPRSSFVAFIRQALQTFHVTGTFESYIFIVNAIFGSGSQILFDVTGPGELEMVINAAASLDFDFVGREFVDGEYVAIDMITSIGEGIQFSGLSGIDSEAGLKSLLSELVPAGISPDISLVFFTLSYFISDAGDFMLDHLGNQIVFFELGE